MSGGKRADLAAFVPVVVAGIVIAVIAFLWPLETEIAGVSMNWVAIVAVGLAGWASTLEQVGGST